MAILMPALNIAREQARGVACSTNQKTLVLAFIAYADENDSTVCEGLAQPNIVGGVHPWVMPPLDYSGGNIVSMNSGPVTREQRYNGPREGVLFKYVKDVDAYHCPGDN